MPNDPFLPPGYALHPGHYKVLVYRKTRFRARAFSSLLEMRRNSPRNSRNFSNITVDISGARGYNDCRLAKCRRAFRRAALRLSKMARLFCHAFIAMNIVQMIRRIICCQTFRLAAKAIECFDCFRYSIIIIICSLKIPAASRPEGWWLSHDDGAFG